MPAISSKRTPRSSSPGTVSEKYSKRVMRRSCLLLVDLFCNFKILALHIIRNAFGDGVDFFHIGAAVGCLRAEIGEASV